VSVGLYHAGKRGAGSGGRRNAGMNSTRELLECRVMMVALTSLRPHPKICATRRGAFAKRDWVVEFCAAGDALCKILLSALLGGVQGNVELSRVSFKLHDQSYKLLLAAPAPREQHVWILRDTTCKPASGHGEHGFLATDSLTRAPGDK
jgi:hypothetical protein